VVSLTETLWAEPLPPSISAQMAELIALTKALQLSEGKTADTYTGSSFPGPACPCSPLERVRVVNC
jgi:hypothetical protein